MGETFQNIKRLESICSRFNSHAVYAISVISHRYVRKKRKNWFISESKCKYSSDICSLMCQKRAIFGLATHRAVIWKTLSFSRLVEGCDRRNDLSIFYCEKVLNARFFSQHICFRVNTVLSIGCYFIVILVLNICFTIVTWSGRSTQQRACFFSFYWTQRFNWILSSSF